MRFINIDKNNPLSEIGIETAKHGVLKFNGRFFLTANATVFDEVFGEWNQFLEYLPKNQHAKLEDYYAEIRDILDDDITSDSAIQDLKLVIKKIYEVVTYDALKYWVQAMSDIRIPKTLKAEHTTEYGRNDGDSTYLIPDYWELVVLCVALRAISPCIGEFIEGYKIVSETVYKEYAASKLYQLSWLAKSEALDKLHRYVVFNCTAKSIKASATNSHIVDGLSTENFPRWLVARAVIRRLTCVKVSVEPGQDDNRSSIVSAIYGFAFHSQLKAMDRQFGGQVIEKIPSYILDRPGKAPSPLEQYRRTSITRISDDEAHNSYAMDALKMAEDIDPSIDKNKLRICLQRIPDLEHMEIGQHQRILVRYMVACCYSHRSVDNHNEQLLLRCIAATQAVLWHWGMLELATMMTATPVISGDSNIAIVSGDPRQKLSNAMLDRLHAHYRFTIRTRKSAIDNDPNTRRRNNPGTVAIEEIVSRLPACAWRNHAPEELEKERSGKLPKHYSVPSGIRDMLGEFILKVTSRSTWLSAIEQ